MKRLNAKCSAHLHTKMFVKYAAASFSLNFLSLKQAVVKLSAILYTILYKKIQFNLLLCFVMIIFIIWTWAYSDSNDLLDRSRTCLGLSCDLFAVSQIFLNRFYDLLLSSNWTSMPFSEKIKGYVQSSMGTNQKPLIMMCNPLSFYFNLSITMCLFIKIKISIPNNSTNWFYYCCVPEEPNLNVTKLLSFSAFSQESQRTVQQCHQVIVSIGLP